MTAGTAQRMHALRYHGAGDVRIEQADVPELAPGDVMVRVAACGVCATDIKTYLRGHPKIRPGAVLGHEVSGVVVRVAPDGSGAHPAHGLRTGDRVAVAPYCPCRRCAYCRRGQFTLCTTLFERTPDPGGFAQYLRIPRDYAADIAVVLPDGLDDLTATLAEPLACSINAVQASGLRPGDDILIIGDGPLGLLQAVAARAVGPAGITVIGKTAQRLAIASGLADHVVDAGAQDMEQAVRALLPAGADVVLLSVGYADLVPRAMRLVRRGGVLDLFAGLAVGTQVSIDAALVHYEGVRIQGSFGFAPAHFRAAVEQLAGNAAAASIITDVVPIEQLPAAIERSARHVGVKTVMGSSPQPAPSEPRGRTIGSRKE